MNDLFNLPTTSPNSNNLGYATRAEYFNTTNLKGRELKREMYKAGSQNCEILYLMRTSQRYNFTPSEVYKSFNCKWPLTSIRRSITSLTKAGYLVQTSIKRVGIYGKPETAWRMK